jgi:hypothetical protein
MNLLTLNLAHDIVTGERTVDEARQFFAETAIKTEMGMEPPYTQGLQFDVPEGDSGDPDESNITDTIKKRVKEELSGSVEAEEE